MTKMKVARKTVAMFAPEELELIIENTRTVWLPWVLISAFAGIPDFRGSANGLVQCAVDTEADRPAP